MDLEDLEVDLDQEGLHYPLHYKLVTAVGSGFYQQVMLGVMSPRDKENYPISPN